MALPFPAAVALALLASAQVPGAAAPDEVAAEGTPAVRPYVIERIAVVGVRHTRESQIRRHLLVSEGDVLDDERVLLSRLRLLQLGWFSRVETRVQRGSERGRVVLVFDVAERNTLLITDLVLGSTAPQPLYGGLGLSQQNFLGAGLGLSGAFVYGGSPADRPTEPARFSARAAFFEPDLRHRGLPPLVYGITAVWIRGEELTCTTPDCEDFRGHFGAAPRLRYSRVGGEVNFGTRPGPFDRFLAGYRLERLSATLARAQVAFPAAAIGPSPFIQEGTSLLSALTGTYDRDTRNDVFFPTEGTRILGHITFSSRAFGSDYEYSRYLLQVESDYGIGHGQALRLLAALGAVQGDAPFFERFYAADWAYFSIGPALGRALEINFSTDSRYDELLAMGGAEYGIPLWSSGQFFQRGYLAVGGRALWTAARPGAGRTRASSTPFSGELALRLDTPVGIFNVSMGYALDNLL